MLKMKMLVLFSGLSLGLAVAPEALSQNQITDRVAPETTISTSERSETTAKTYMIAAANPLAVKAGEAVLARGGTAADALIAVQAVLGLVEPQSSGLGGGAFLLYYNAETKELITLDGRDTAPMAATPTLFQNDHGEPLGFFDAVVGGRSVGVPGTPKLLEETHKRFGKLEWSTLFNEAITLATDGFEISPRLAGAIAKDGERLQQDPTVKAYFFNEDGSPKPAGTLLQNPDYAKSLERLATEGSAPFYQGDLAENIVAAIKGASWNPGVMAHSDLQT